MIVTLTSQELQQAVSEFLSRKGFNVVEVLTVEKDPLPNFDVVIESDVN